MEKRNALYSIGSFAAAIVLSYVLAINVGFKVTSNYVHGQILESSLLQDEKINTYRLRVRFKPSDENDSIVFTQNYYIDHGPSPSSIQVQHYQFVGQRFNIVGQNEHTYGSLILQLFGVAMFCSMGVIFWKACRLK